jgi:SPP1 family predicted phage head-tail adaptor
MTLAAGRLRDRVTLQAKSVTRGDFGDEVVTWGTHATLWASVESLSGREYIEQQFGVDQVRATRAVRVVLRYRDDVVPWMRLVHGGRVLEIQTVIKRGLDELHALCLDINETT